MRMHGPIREQHSRTMRLGTSTRKGRVLTHECEPFARVWCTRVRLRNLCFPTSGTCMRPIRKPIMALHSQRLQHGTTYARNAASIIVQGASHSSSRRIGKAFWVLVAVVVFGRTLVVAIMLIVPVVLVIVIL